MAGIVSYCLRHQGSGVLVASKVARADSYIKRLAGLLFSEPLEPGQGLWLSPCNGVHSMGMRFAIDVVFLDKAGKVVHVINNFRPFRFSPHIWTARHCIELAAGELAAHSVRTGDFLSWSPNS